MSKSTVNTIGQCRSKYEKGRDGRHGGGAVKNQVPYSLQSRQTALFSAFQSNESSPNQRVYKKPGVDLHQYNEVLLDPLQFIRQENGQCYLLTANEQNQIGRYYHDKFQIELDKHCINIATASALGASVGCRHPFRSDPPRHCGTSCSTPRVASC